MDLKEVYAEMSREERNSIIEYLKRSSSGKNMKPKFRPLLETVVKGKLLDLKKKQGRQLFFESDYSEAGIIAGAAHEEIRAENSLLYKDLGTIEDKDVPLVAKIIMDLANKLKRNTRKRYKGPGRAGLDFKGTIRASVSKGGALCKLKYKRKSGQRQKILTLCDVSASMFRFSGFVLKFISCLHSEASATEHFLFSTSTVRLNTARLVATADYEQEIKKSGVWKKGTDIGQALRHIMDSRDLILNRSTIIIIVSDAKTVFAAEAAAELKRLASLVKKIYWLNPIPETEWDRIPNLDDLRGNCLMLDCSTLEKLSKACTRL